MTATTHPAPVPETGRLPLTGGRRAALLIGVPVCLVLILTTALSLVASFGEGTYPVRYTAAGARSLSLSTPGGQLWVTGKAAGPATVTGTARYSLVKSVVSAHTAGGVARVGYRCQVPFGDGELSLNATVPAGGGVTATTPGGDAVVTDTAGPVTVSSGGGNLAANGASGPLSLSTSGGNINGNQLAADAVTASSGGGDVTLIFARVPHSVRVTTSGGNITLVVPPGSYRVTTHSDSGDSAVSDTVHQDATSPNVIDASTGGGHITIRQR
ncbi:MAG TPA: DUF4097 family beta strand repeat-containing protein [Trebonia sp.]|nr:DUF4097 family beta strand repeat-containing protein [Trebonia sp.]